VADGVPFTAPTIRVTAMAADANPYGTMFVGWLMGQMALAAGSVASQRCRGQAPVVAAEGLSFTAPVLVGDEVSFHARIVAVGTSSMTVDVECWRRERHGDGTERAARGQFKLVSMGPGGRPRPVDGYLV